MLAARRVRTPAAATEPVECAHDAAFLAGGRRLAALSALAALRVDGLVKAVDGRVRSVGSPGPGRHPLELALQAATAAEPVPLHTLARSVPVRTQLDAIARRLATAGLLTVPEPPPLARRAPWALAALAAVAVLGLARTAQGAANGQPFDYVLLATVVVAVVTLALANRPPATTRRDGAQEQLDRLRNRPVHLNPRLTPSWRTHGAAGAAMGVALYGKKALRAADPTFARAVEGSPVTPTRRPTIIAGRRSVTTADS